MLLNHKKNRAVLFTVEGMVEQGEKKGGKLGFPTANLSCDDSMPAGIYAGEAIWNGIVYPAAIYKENGKNAVEAHLLDFSENLYGEKLTIRGYQKVRDVKMFPNEKELIAAISKDIDYIKKWHSKS